MTKIPNDTHPNLGAPSLGSPGAQKTAGARHDAAHPPVPEAPAVLGRGRGSTPEVLSVCRPCQASTSASAHSSAVWGLKRSTISSQSFSPSDTHCVSPSWSTRRATAASSITTKPFVAERMRPLRRFAGGLLKRVGHEDFRHDAVVPKVFLEQLLGAEAKLFEVSDEKASVGIVGAKLLQVGAERPDERCILLRRG